MDLASRLETVEAVLKAEITARLAAEARAKEEFTRTLEATNRLSGAGSGALVAALEARLAALETSASVAASPLAEQVSRLAVRVDALSEATAAATARAEAACTGLAALQPLASASGARGARSGVLERLDAIETAIEGVWRDLATQEALNEETRAALDTHAAALGLPRPVAAQAADAVLEEAVAAAEKEEERAGDGDAGAE